MGKSVYVDSFQRVRKQREKREREIEILGVGPDVKQSRAEQRGNHIQIHMRGWLLREIRHR